MIHLAVEQLRVPDGADVHFLANPFGAIAGDALLLKPVGELQSVAFDNECFLLGLIRIEG